MAKASFNHTSFSMKKNTNKGNKKTIKVTRKQTSLKDLLRKYIG